MIGVTLTQDEVLNAVHAAGQRRTNALFKGTPGWHGAHKRDEWAIDIEGACGEVAAAKALNVYWPGAGELRAPDCGGYQVRTAAPRPYDRKPPRLLVRPDADDGAIYVFVVGTVPSYVVHGWLYGREAKQSRYKDDPNRDGWAYWVPPQDLHPLDTLPCLPIPAAEVFDRD